MMNFLEHENKLIFTYKLKTNGNLFSKIFIKKKLIKMINEHSYYS